MSDDEAPVIQPPSGMTVDEAPPTRVLVYRPDGKPAVTVTKRAGFYTGQDRAIKRTVR